MCFLRKYCDLTFVVSFTAVKNKERVDYVRKIHIHVPYCIVVAKNICVDACGPGSRGKNMRIMARGGGGVFRENVKCDAGQMVNRVYGI